MNNNIGNHKENSDDIQNKRDEEKSKGKKMDGIMSWFKKNPKTTQILSLILGISLIGVVLFLTGIESVINHIQNMNFFWVIIASVVFILSYLIRGFRWKPLLKTYENEEFNPSVFTLSKYNFFGNYMNLVLPFKIGDLTKGLVLSKKEGQKFSFMLVTIVLERVFDIIALGLLIVIPVYLFGIEFIFINDFKWAVLLMFVLIGAIVLFFLIIIFKKKFVLDLLGRILVLIPLIKEREGFQIEIKSIFEQLNICLANVFEKVTTIFRVILSSVLIWTFEGLTAFFIALAMGETISFPLILSAVIIGNLMKIIPITPGGIGIYEAVFALVLSFVGIDPALASVIAVIDHLIKNVVLSSIGGIISLSYSKVEKQPDSKK